MTDLAPRFYVIATSGHNATGRGRRVATSYAVLDRLWAFREVYSDSPPEGGGGLPDAVRRTRAEAHAEALNARHEQHMREVAAA